jgi:hypothetical protein
MGFIKDLLFLSLCIRALRLTARGLARFGGAKTSDACDGQDNDRGAEECRHEVDGDPGIAVPAVAIGAAQEDEVEWIGCVNC